MNVNKSEVLGLSLEVAEGRLEEMSFKIPTDRM